MDGKFSGKPDNDRWQKNVAHLTSVPSLAAMGKRFRYPWVVGFLMDPHDLRPALEQSMPRLKLTRAEARDIATYLMQGAERPREVALTGADKKRGRSLLEQKACGTCHRFTGVEALPNAPTSSGKESRLAISLAPDLRHARDRLDASTVVAWLLDPQSMKPGTLMPQTPMSPSEARDVATYILESDLAPVPAHQIPELPKPLDRQVTYAEVAEKVLDKTCRHCHGNPDVARGDGGPGNTGGFGFKPRGLQLDSYERVQAGYLDDKGERQSAFVADDHGTPRMVAALLARHAEEAGKPNPDIRGMPLGLPPLPVEDIQLLVTWIAKGRPR
jgi:cytochrome c2